MTKKTTNRRGRNRRGRRKNKTDKTGTQQNKGDQQGNSSEGQVHPSKEKIIMGEENKQLDDMKTPIPNVSVKTSNSESLASAIEMKHWFSTLSVEERVAALGFSDGPVLSTFLQLASSSLSGAIASHGNPSHQHSSQERTTDKPMKGTVLPP